MTVAVTQDLVVGASKGGLDCPVHRALSRCGYAPLAVEFTRFLYVREGEAYLQPLPQTVTDAIHAFNETGRMADMTFELPDPT